MKALQKIIKEESFFYVPFLGEFDMFPAGVYRRLILEGKHETILWTNEKGRIDDLEFIKYLESHRAL